ncbi:MAG: CinA family protein [Clostridia bacterium]|nr:CinA family protein [Clostridia bacterium]
MNRSEKLVKALKKRNLTVFTAESCTGGLIAKKITDVPGASAVLNGGIVSYTNAIKSGLLHVKKRTLARYTAVSPQVAEEMALGAAKFGDIGVSVTGYASGGDGVPDGCTGLVFIGIAQEDMVTTEKYLFSGTRSEIREQAADAAIDIILKHIGEQ